MRVLFLSLALCCLMHVVTPQTEVFKLEGVGEAGINYYIKTADNEIDLATSDPCQAEGKYIAVWESEKEYVAFIEAMKDKDTTVAPNAMMLLTGLRTSDGEAETRTYHKARLAPYVNFWDSSGAILTGTTKAGDFYARLTFDRTQYGNFHYSKWSYGPSTLSTGDHFICTDTPDPECTKGCRATRKDNREDDKSCFWKHAPPTPEHPPELLTWTEAKYACHKYGGHLMNLIDDADIAKIKEFSKDDPSFVEFWIGMVQKKGNGTPTWSDGQQIDEQDAWEGSINYGSSSHYFPYAGKWKKATQGMNLYQVADGMTMEEPKALAVCEAPKAYLCKYSAPDVKHAEKTVCCDDAKLRYTCKPGWEFPDGKEYKEIDCRGCNWEYHDVNISNCILKNPCKYDYHLCGAHGDCIFSNQYEKPYYCVCKAGYKWDDAHHTCVDIDECLDLPCGRYGGHCMNTPGSYWCQCDKDSNWDDGYCSKDKPDVVAVHTMTIYFHVNMKYDPHMNDPKTSEYDHFKKALELLTSKVYFGDHVKMVDFYIKEESYGKMKVKVVFNLYIAADITTVSKYVWKFYTHIKTSDYFMYDSNTYPFYGSMYFESPTKTIEIAISSPCSIFEAMGTCHGSYCTAKDHYTPECNCRHGYYGQYCENREGKPPHSPDGLTDTEVGLVVSVCILFLMVIIMPICVICCFHQCKCCKPPRKGLHHQEHGVYASTPYSSSHAYVTKPASVPINIPNPYSQPPTYVAKASSATRYPQFRII